MAFGWSDLWVPIIPLVLLLVVVVGNFTLLTCLVLAHCNGMLLVESFASTASHLFRTGLFLHLPVTHILPLLLLNAIAFSTVSITLLQSVTSSSLRWAHSPHIDLVIDVVELVCHVWVLDALAQHALVLVGVIRRTLLLVLPHFYWCLGFILLYTILRLISLQSDVDESSVLMTITLLPLLSSAALLSFISTTCRSFSNNLISFGIFIHFVALGISLSYLVG